jgi:hypothetical protein
MNENWKVRYIWHMEEYDDAGHHFIGNVLESLVQPERSLKEKSRTGRGVWVWGT